MKSKVYIGIGILVFLVGSIFLGKLYIKKNYELIQPRKGEVVEAIYGLGKVVSDETFEIKLGVITTVEQLYVDEGIQVQKDQKLISFEGSRLFKAPISGTVTKINYEKGEVVTPQSVVLKIENLDKKYIEVSLEQDAALRVKPGLETKITFESESQKKYTGSVKHIYPRDGEFITHVEVDNLSQNILPGMTADVVIIVGKKEDVLLIPSRSISEGRVLIKRGKKRKKIEVETGNNDGMWSEVIKGDIQLNDDIIMKR